ncbi:hypothetical protein K469DRAFT_695363 [Zopfia rhizophila CBS 207.26]|uniref:Uncharacterized protein n=1 Tax=Zopfia rhizophila CBS 207.26 TaxID=1314779 RepID=A0A6A6DGD4_9PEZI|nr:hypothetical protein K469DRAFT_695363 [Zopfia rhizophila CBS 207.26]
MPEWLCPFSYYLIDHPHFYRNPQGWHGARWRYWLHRKACCEWCEIWREYYRQFFLVKLDPLYFDALWHEHPVFLHIGKSFRRIHAHFRGGLDDNSYRLSWEVEQLSQIMWIAYKAFPELWQLERVAEELKGVATDLQVGPRRKLSYTIP